jgi:hypothetical protein
MSMSAPSRDRRGVVAATALAVMALVPARTAPTFDPEATFAKGTTILGMQVGGRAVNNVEGHRTVSDISFITATPRASYLFFAPFGSGLLRGALEPGLEGWFQHYRSPDPATAAGLKLTARNHFIGLGRLVPYLEVTITELVALTAGYRFQHIPNGHTSDPNRGFNSDSGGVGVSFYFK